MYFGGIMAIIFTRPAVASGKNVYLASEILNDSTIPGLSVKEALESIAGGELDVSRFVFNQALTTVSGTTVFSIPDIPVSNTVQMYINGLLQKPGIGEDYVVLGEIITLTSGVEEDDILVINYIKSTD